MVNERQRATRKDSHGRILQRGEGQDKSGRYYFNYIDSNKKRRRIYAKDLMELRQKEKDIQKSIEKGINFDAGKRTLNEQFEIYLQIKNIRETTKLQYRGRWDAHIKEALGDKRLVNIKKSDIQLFYKKLSDLGMKDTSIQAYSQLLHPVLESAVNDDIIIRNPAKGCLREYTEKSKTKEALTLEQQEILLNFVRSSNRYNRYLSFIMFALATACRKGEIIGLTWDDIDMDRRIVSINHQLRFVSENGKIKCITCSPKTSAGIRELPMTAKCYQALLEQKNNQVLSGINHNLEIGGIKNFVFTTSAGTPYTPSNVNFFLGNIVKAYNKIEQSLAVKENREAKLLPQISCHTLRHTACTRLAECNVDIKVLQKFMGHADIKTTMNIYNHVDSVRMRNEIEKAERVSRIV